MESIEQYLGPEIRKEFDATFDGTEFKLLGVHRNILPSNWKLYQENLKDPYHATLLHTYLTTFGLFVSSNDPKYPPTNVAVTAAFSHAGPTVDLMYQKKNKQICKHSRRQ